MKFNSLKEIIIDSDGNKIGVIVNINGIDKQMSISDVLSLIDKGFKLSDCTVENNTIYLIPENNSKFESIKDKQFNEWHVLEYLGRSMWLCECSCEKRRAVAKKSLTSGKSKSCGHLTNISGDITEHKFGDWKVLRQSSNGYWTCECKCGTVRDVWKGSLLKGESTSCGHDTNAFIDLSEQTIGDWYVDEYVGNGSWLCTCSCGEVRVVQGNHLRNKTSLSCGHATNKLKNLEGMQIGLWTVGKKTGSNGHNTLYNCVCDCGREREVNGQSLRLGDSTCCGQCNRTDKQLEIISTADKFNSTLLQLYIAKQGPLTLTEIADYIGTGKSTVKRLTSKYNSQCYLAEKDAGISEAEKSLFSFVKYNTDCEVLNNVRPIENVETNSKLELDVYVPDKQVAIEYNGVYWHSSLHKEPKYHLNKTLSCNKKGISLIHIFEHEYANERLRPILNDIIVKKLGTISNRVYARNTKIQTLDSDTVRAFLNENHLQGYVDYDVAYGLYYNDILVEVMTFGKPRFTHDYETELLRLSTKLGYSIVGGASKLFKHFIKDCNPSSVISYCDISKFNGKVYENLGMKLDGLTSIGYSYVNSHLHEMHRMSCTKKKLIERGWGREEQTEEEIMYNHGYYKIYNCGNLRYVYNRP